ncbi:hypothetical protein Ciccas_014457, partial [Cichlidogyrus casuarinus]
MMMRRKAEQQLTTEYGSILFDPVNFDAAQVEFLGIEGALKGRRRPSAKLFKLFAWIKLYDALELFFTDCERLMEL